MKRFLMLIATLSTLLLIPSVIHAQGTEAIEIPVGPPPTLDGVISPGEWESAVQIPLGEIPLNAMAMHDGDSVYLVLEITSPSAGWESFVVKDNGDGVFYDAGDKMIDCNADGCKSCEYTAPYDFTCSEEHLPGAVEGGVAEVQVPVDMIASQLVFGVIMGGYEMISPPIDVKLEVPALVGTPSPEPDSTPSPELTSTPSPSPTSTPSPTPTSSPSPQAGPGISGICIGLAAAVGGAALAWFVYSVIKWYAERQKKREADEAAKPKPKPQLKPEAKERSSEQVKKDNAARKAADTAKKIIDALLESVRLLEEALADAKRVDEGQPPVNNPNYKKSKPVAMKRDIQAKAKKVSDLVRAAQKAANAAGKAAQGASPDYAKAAQDAANAARKAIDTANQTLQKVPK